MASRDEVPQECAVWVDVIVPVHNASGTIVETIESAMHQIIPPDVALGPRLDVCVCCYDDGSTDNSWSLLKQLALLPEKKEEASYVGGVKISTRLLIHKSESGISRGAGYARNQAASLRQRFELNDATTTTNKPNQYYFLCLLDSDDVMHETRIAHQVSTMLALPSDDARHLTLLGCQFDRDPPDSTWHYAHWANHLLTPDRLSLEQFREITLLQPTWMLSRSRFDQLGGYIEAPAPKPTTFDAAAATTAADTTNDFIQKYDDFRLTDEGWQYKDVKLGVGNVEIQDGDRVVFDWSGYTIGYFGRPFQAKGGPQGGAFDKELDFSRTVVGSGQMVKGVECALRSMKPGGIRQVVVPYGALGYPIKTDPEHVLVGPTPTTFSGMRALNFVLENPRVDRTLLFNIKVIRVDKANGKGGGFTRG
uniref:peptidylprolyl isomerase n=1 Tax=Attheya septentrionalis TaxID=420275 RepID=A0A7S2URI3_9STRA|mmetsp:Transcript_7771/g.14000  ORF Transcript_7771/g.14000 Transcript_7771/m.14000 type:complete len:421 (+) Transcript_7771:303-1565(+)